MQRLIDAGARLRSARPTSTSSRPAWSARARPTAGRAARSRADASAAARARARRCVVARGDVPFALGTDTAGSGRVPAGFNNIVGLKPTPGRVSTRGVVPACRSLDCVSIFALTVADAARVLALIEGADAADPYSALRAGPAQLPRVAARRRAVARRSSSATPATRAAFERAVAHAAARSGHQRGRRSTSRRCTRSPTLLYDGPVGRRAPRRGARRCWPRSPRRSTRRCARSSTRARGYQRDRRLPRPVRAARRAARAARALAAGRPADGADRARPPAPRRGRCRPDRRQRAARHSTPTSSTCSAGARWRCRPASRADGLPFGVTFIAPRGARRRARALRRALAARARAAARRDRRAAAAARAHEPLAGAGRPARPTLPIAVVGAHLRGLPLNGQLTERGAALREATHTAPHYRLYALPGTTPPKPGLLRVAGRRRRDRGRGLGRCRSRRRLVPRADRRRRSASAASSSPTAAACTASSAKPHALAGASDITALRRLARLPRSLARRAAAAMTRASIRTSSSSGDRHDTRPPSRAARIARTPTVAAPPLVGGAAPAARSPRSALPRLARAQAGAEDPHRLLAGRRRPAVLRRDREGLLQGSRASTSSRSSSPARSR